MHKINLKQASRGEAVWCGVPHEGATWAVYTHLDILDHVGTMKALPPLAFLRPSVSSVGDTHEASISAAYHNAALEHDLRIATAYANCLKNAAPDAPILS